MIYVRGDIPSKMLTKHNLSEDIEVAFIELNFRKCKWLLHFSPPKFIISFLIILMNV